MSGATHRSNFVLLGLGANLGDPVKQLAGALRYLANVITCSAVSLVYRSAPVGYTQQPDFHNLVCAGRTAHTPGEFLAAVQQVEARLGRIRPFPNAPRLIDIDLLAYGELVSDTPDLILPHPRLHQRAFVLVPLAEIAPEWRHPILNLTASEMLSAGGPWERVERWGPLPGFGDLGGA